MFRAWHNSLALKVRVSPMGALQVADVTAWDAVRVGMGFVRAEGLFGRTVFVPASSVRGVMRSFSERLLLGLGLRACDPLAPNACGMGRDAAPRRIYLESCFVCRTFGSGQLAGRVVVGDFWPWNSEAVEATQRDECATANRTERRGGIAIDRRTRAGALGHESEVEVVTRGAFYGDVILTNYQLWQPALIGLALREIEEGYLTIGGGSGRGFGRVLCRVVGATLRQSLDVRAAAGSLDGASRKIIGAGGFEADELPVPDGVTWEREPLADVARLSGKEWTRLFEALLDGPWREFVTSREKDRSNHRDTENIEIGGEEKGGGKEEGDAGVVAGAEAGVVADAGAVAVAETAAAEPVPAQDAAPVPGDH